MPAEVAALQGRSVKLRIPGDQRALICEVVAVHNYQNLILTLRPTAQAHSWTAVAESIPPWESPDECVVILKGDTANFSSNDWHWCTPTGTECDDKLPAIPFPTQQDLVVFRSLDVCVQRLCGTEWHGPMPYAADALHSVLPDAQLPCWTESDWGAQTLSSEGTGAFLLGMSTIHNHIKTRGVICHHCYRQTRHQWLRTITRLNIHAL